MRQHRRTVTIKDLSGGINLSKRPDHIDPNELSDGRNILYGPARRPKKRPGNIRLNGSSLGGTARWLFPYRSSNGTEYLHTVVGTELRESGSGTFGTFAAIKTGLNSSARYSGVNVQGRAYIVNGVDNSLRIDGTGVADMGATPPVNGMSGSAVAGAGLGVGAYKYRVSFIYHGFQESNGSSAETTVNTSGGNQQINLSSIPTGAAGSGVTARRLYRTTVGGTLEKLVTTINDNVTTTYSDTTADGSLGANYLLDQGLPPISECIEYLPDSHRIALARKTTLIGYIYYSSVDSVDVYPALNTFGVCPGTEITAIKYLPSRGLMVWNDKETYLCYGEDPLVWRVTRLADGIGCLDKDSIQIRHVQGEPWVIWRGQEHLYYYNGAYIAVLSKPIDPELPKIPQSFRVTFSSQPDWLAGTYTDALDLTTTPGLLTTYTPRRRWTSQVDFDMGFKGFMLSHADGYLYPDYKGKSVESWDTYQSTDSYIEAINIIDDNILRLVKPNPSEALLKTEGDSGATSIGTNSNILGGSGASTSTAASTGGVFFFSNPKQAHIINPSNYGSFCNVPPGQEMVYEVTFDATPESITGIYLRLSGEVGTQITLQYFNGSYNTLYTFNLNSGNQALYANGTTLGVAVPSGTTKIRIKARHDTTSSSGFYSFNLTHLYFPGYMSEQSRVFRIDLGDSTIPGSETESVEGTNGTIQGTAAHYIGTRFSNDASTWTSYVELAANTVSGSMTSGATPFRYREIRVRMTSPNRSTRSELLLLFPRAHWISEIVTANAGTTGWASLIKTSGLAGASEVYYFRYGATSVACQSASWNLLVGTDISSAGTNRFLQVYARLAKSSGAVTQDRITEIDVDYALSGTWTSGVINFGSNVTAWGLFQANYAANSQTATFEYKLGTAANNVDSDSWHSITPGNNPTQAVKQYGKVRITLATNNPDQIPNVDSFFWYWYEGGSEANLQLSSAFWRDNYYHGTWDRGGTAPTSIWVFDEENVWCPKWTGLTVYSMAVHYNKKLYFGCSDGYIYEHGTGLRDHDQAIDAWFYTKEFKGFVPEDADRDERYYAKFDVEVEGTGDFDSTFGIQVDRGTFVDFTVNMLGSGSIIKTCSPSPAQMPYLHGNSARFKFQNNGLDEDFEFHEVSIDYYPKSRRKIHL